MKGACLVIAGSLAIMSAVSGYLQAAGREQQSSTTPSPSAIAPRAILDRYCVTCHNEKLRTAGLTLDTLDIAQIGARAEVWEKVVRKLRAGVMPPVGRPRPDKAAYDSLAAYLESSLDRAAAAHPNPGRIDAVRRLNRTEYRNAIRDVLGLEIDVTDLLPPDDSSNGFDHIGLGGLDSGRLERYLAAARKVSRMAVGAPMGSPVADTVVLPSDFRQDDHVEGLPFGTRGGTVVRYNFPLDAEYVIQVELSRNILSNNVSGLTEPHQVVFIVDGQWVDMLTVAPSRSQGRGQQPDSQNQVYTTEQRPDAALRVRIPIEAGPHDVGAAFLSKGFSLIERQRRPFLRMHITELEDQRTQPAIHAVTITGPFDATGPGDTASRRRIFVCRPATAADEPACARTIISTIARRAYRRPVAEEDLQPLLAFYNQGRAGAHFDAGIEMALRGLLANPEFLFRLERDRSDHGSYRITDLELASRLSFFLWSSIPDDELLDVAAQGKLSHPEVLRKQVLRMLADGRAEALVSNFAEQWLLLRNLATVTPDLTVFPDFDDSLRRGFRRETELFFESIIREDRSVLDLLSGNYTFVNERLARHYGIPYVYGEHFRRITLGPRSVRGGLLGQGSILTVTAYATRTSPVLRGKWIMENILGTPPPPPPANVPPLKETNTEQVLSMRERMVQHRANPVCAGCHAMMDPIGLSLENFDAVGRWRTRTESLLPLDVSGGLPDGSTFEGAAGLKAALLKRPELFVATLTERLLTYGTGRALEYYDSPAVRKIVRDAAREDYRFSSLILGVVRSTPFQMRRSTS